MYEQVGKAKECKSRAVANPVTQNKSNAKKGFEFVNNCSKTNKLKALQFKSDNDTRQIGQQVYSSDREVLQLLKVPDDHVCGDLRHKDRRRLFTPDTFQDILPRVGLTDVSQLGTRRVRNDVLEAAVNASRAEGNMNYRQLSQQKISSEKQMTKFLNKNKDDEHMYVLDNGELHVAIRAEGKKLPHPTLVGGDPDVDCAGTLRFEDGAVIVTCSSGHFRPPTEGKGKRFVSYMMRKTESKKYKKKVIGKRS